MDTDPDPGRDRTRLETSLEGLRTPYELFPCDPALADTAQFCAAYGFELDESANTIVVVGKADPRRYAACVVLAPHRLDVNRVVKARLGTRKASFAGADETRELTGMAIGGVTPFGRPMDLPVWVDAAVLTRSRVVLGGGSRSWKVIASPQILLELPNVAVVEGLAAPPADRDPALTDELDPRELERARRRDRAAEAERRALLRPGMGKVFKQIQDTQARAADDPPKRRRKRA